MNRRDELRKRHRERKRRVLSVLRPGGLPPANADNGYDQTYHPLPDWKATPSENRRSFSLGHRLLIQCICSGLLFFAVYWMVSQGDERFNGIEKAARTAMGQEFRFAAVSDWYEKHLGQPIGFLPDFIGGRQDQPAGGETEHSGAFGVPVSGEVTDHFNNENNGITFQTSPNSDVEAAKDGQVIFVGEREKTGRTVIIQHKDSDESWYGKLDQIDVKVYEFVVQGQKIGTTSTADADGKVSFYFALKEGENFIDPIQVISLD